MIKKRIIGCRTFDITPGPTPMIANLQIFDTEDEEFLAQLPSGCSEHFFRLAVVCMQIARGHRPSDDYDKECSKLSKDFLKKVPKAYKRHYIED